MTDGRKDEALAAATETNLVTHMAWLQARTTGMRVIDEDRFLLVDSGLPCDTFNFVARTRLAPAGIDAAVADVLGQFDGRPFSWWVGPMDRPTDLGGRLARAGLAIAESERAMVADLANRSAHARPPGLHIERITDRPRLREFASLLAALWTPPATDVLHFYEAAAPALLEPNGPIALFLGRLGGTPVATAELVFAGGVAGLYNISTQARWRRRGIGGAMTQAMLDEAAERGVTHAILQASQDGERVYARLGFRGVGVWTEYQPVASR